MKSNSSRLRMSTFGAAFCKLVLLPWSNFCCCVKYKIDSARVICFGSAAEDPTSSEEALIAPAPLALAILFAVPVD